jgi:hypothetical protein
MDAPPPVRVSVGRDRRWVVAVALLAAAAAANAMAWGLARLETDFTWTTAAAVLVAASLAGAGGATLAWWRAPRGDLSWDGQGWSWAPVDGSAGDGEVTVAFDLDGWMLLRFDPLAGPRRWLPLARLGSTAAWSALRGALYGPRPADVATGPPPAGSPR